MNRFGIGLRAIPPVVLASALWLAGCGAQSSPTPESQGEEDVVAPGIANVYGEDQSLLGGHHTRARENGPNGTSHPTCTSCGPHPEPWQDRLGPHPEPWDPNNPGDQDPPAPDPNPDPDGNGKP